MFELLILFIIILIHIFCIYGTIKIFIDDLIYIQSKYTKNQMLIERLSKIDVESKTMMRLYYLRFVQQLYGNIS